MSNKNLNNLIYPFLIIIFSILFIFGILRIRKMNTLEKNLDTFINYNSNSTYNSNNFKEHFIDESINDSYSNDYIKSVLNGKWTTINSSCDSSGNVSETMTISIDNLSTNELELNSTTGDYSTTSNLGKIQINDVEYDVKYASIDNLTARSINMKSLSLSILFNNRMGDDNKTEKPLNDPNTFNGVLSIYMDNTLVYKYAIYKINDDAIASPDLCRIIQSKNILIEQPPPIYDFKTYNTIINDYKFPSNYLSISNWTTNTDIVNVIQKKYAGQIQFAIQRVFNSPASKNADIISYLSDPVILNCVDGSQIPKTLTVTSFENDKNVNQLQSFFVPKATILHFFKFKDTDVTYEYKDADLLEKPITSMNFRNGGNESMKNTIKFNNINTVQLVNTNNYIVTYIATANSNYESPTNFDFSQIYPLL